MSGLEIPPPLQDEVVVWVLLENGERLESPLMLGVTASSQQLAIKMRRDKDFNYERSEVPEWLPDDFDYSKVADAGTEYRGPA